MSTRRMRRTAAILAMAGVLLGLIGGATAQAAPGDVVPDDTYRPTSFHRAWHSGKVDFFAYPCGDQGEVCRPIDADITVHDRKGDGTTCTDLQTRFSDQGWRTVGTVCEGRTEVIELRHLGNRGNIAFRLSIAGYGFSNRILCVRNGDGPEPCR